MADRILFQTSDRVALVGTFLAPAAPKGAVLLLHMMPDDRTSWVGMQEALKQEGVASLAIDLRGHGESIHQGENLLDYHLFRDADHQTSMEDVKTAVQWLANRGFAKIGLVGASIGANLAIVYAADHAEIPLLVLFSPGENYHGIKALEAAAKLAPQQTLLLLASQGDDQDSFEAATKMLEVAPSVQKALKPYSAGGHGTRLLKNDPGLTEELAHWISGMLAA